jgi:hypothetical protein
MGKYLHSYIESGTLRAYTCMYTTDKSTKRWTFTLPKLTSLSAFSSIERFLGTGVGWCEGRTLGRR